MSETESDTAFELPTRGAIFWPVGTGDTTTIVVNDEKWVQIDIHDVQGADDDDDPRVPVVDRLCELTPQRDGEPYIAAFAATHLDKDHICGFGELNERALLGELWFSPQVFWDAGERDTLADDAKAFINEVDRRIDVIRAKGTVGSGDRILIVGHDDILSEYPYSELPAECFVRPGEFFDTIDGDDHGDIFRAFVHAPFKNDGSKERNDTSLALQITLADGETTGTVMTFGDLAYPDVKKIFERSSDDDLLWSVFQAPHHCSKSVMYWKDEGEDDASLKQHILDEIEAAADERGAWVVASCECVPAKDEPGANPPHKIAADRYEGIVDAGRFLVTGDHAPDPLVFELGTEGLCTRGDGKTPKGPTPGEAASAASGTALSGHSSATTFG
jgi:hypothetical protein